MVVKAEVADVEVWAGGLLAGAVAGAGDLSIGRGRKRGRGGEGAERKVEALHLPDVAWLAHYVGCWLEGFGFW